jgi:hypothetical protein
MSSELTYISFTRVNNYANIDAVKVDVIKTLARWFSNYYVFGENAVESWVQREGTEIYVLYNHTFQFELQRLEETSFELTMYAVGRFRRHGSSCDFFERVLDGLEQQLKHPSPPFATMTEAITSKQSEDCIDFGTPLQYTYSSSVSGALPPAGAFAETVVYDEEDEEDEEDDEEVLREDEYYNGRDGGYGGNDGGYFGRDDEEVANLDATVPNLDEDADSEEEDEDSEEEDDESTVASLEDEYDSDDEDEHIMSMRLCDMTDNQIDRYIDLSGELPRDEIDRWTMNFRGGAIPRYSYVNFAEAWISDQNVSEITIRRAKFAGCTLRNFVFEQVHFDECDFKSVVLENVTFRNCQFTECDLDPYMSLDNTCSVENHDYEEDMLQAMLEDNVTYRYC